METDSGIVLSIPQLRICLKLLNYLQWDDLPLLVTDEPMEQRMLNAFLDLIQAGHLEATPGGYVLKADFMNVITHIGAAEQTCQLWDESRVWALLYEKSGAIVAIVPDFGMADHCKILLNVGSTLEEVVNALSEGHSGLMLHNQMHTIQETDQYNLSHLEWFFGGRMEETE